MTSLTLAAPAKINYLLDVVGKRPDSYHELRMIMQRVSLCDDITISLSETPGISITCQNSDAPDNSDNIAWKAADALLTYSGLKSGVQIDIIKRIPVAAGLGGGSSDAATVLMGLNQLAELGLTEQTLMEIGRTLGADVPFFIFKKAALAEGIGEKLSAYSSLPHAFIVLVNPGIPVSTARVFKSLQLTNNKQLTILPKFFDTLEHLASFLSNDLESVTIAEHPVIAEIKSKLVKLGAVASLMSGSGATVFAIFKDRNSAEKACETIQTGTDWFAVVTETI